MSRRRSSKEIDRVGRRDVSHGVGVDRVELVEVHAGLVVPQVQLAEVLLRDHGHGDLLGLLLLRWLLAWDLQLGGVEVHEVGLLLLLRGVLLRLRGWLSRSRGLVGLRLLRWRHLLCLRDKGRRVLGDVIDERREGRVAKEGLDQATVTVILLKESAVLLAKSAGLLGLQSNFTLELRDVFCRSC